MKKLTPKQEIKAIKESDEARRLAVFFERYGGRSPALSRLLELMRNAPQPTLRKESRLTTTIHGGPCALRIKNETG